MVVQYLGVMASPVYVVMMEIVVSQIGLCTVMQQKLLLPTTDVHHHSHVLNTRDLVVTRGQESGKGMLNVKRNTSS
jgi:hypothetical protein